VILDLGVEVDWVIAESFDVLDLVADTQVKRQHHVVTGANIESMRQKRGQGAEDALLLLALEG
jgi:hypothetical protein